MRLIDADALIDKYGDWYTEEGTEEGYIGTIKGIVDSMPTIEPQRTGKWIEYDNSHCECPLCHEEWSYFDNDVERFNYCPNCGARMKEPEDIPMEYFESGGR